MLVVLARISVFSDNKNSVNFFVLPVIMLSHLVPILFIEGKGIGC